MTATSHLPLRAGNGGVITEQLDALPASGTSAIGVNASGKLSLFDSLTSDQTVALVAAAIASIPAVDLSSKLDLSATTAFTRSLLDDVDAATVRTTLGLGTGDSPTFHTLNAQSVHASGNVTVPNTGMVRINDRDDDAHGIRYCGSRDSQFVDGPLVVGYAQGALGTWAGSTIALRWNSDRDVFVGRNLAVSGTIEQRNGTNGQRFRLAKTWTSDTSHEYLELDAASEASSYRIGSRIGSAGGATRHIEIGSWNAAGTWTRILVCEPSGGIFRAGGNNFVVGGDGSILSNGAITLAHVSSIQFNNTFAGSGAVEGRIIRSGTNELSIRATAGTKFRNLADSADAPITCGAITASGKLSNWDAFAQRYELAPHGGTAYGLEYNGFGVDGGVLKLGFGEGCSYIAGGQQGAGIFHVFVGSVVSPRLTIFGDGTVLIPGNVAVSGGLISAFKSNVSATNFEALIIDAAAVDGSTPVYRIGSRIGSAGGATRGLQFGSWNAAGAFVNALEISSNGLALVTPNDGEIGNTSGVIAFGGGNAFLSSPGTIRIGGPNANGFRILNVTATVVGIKTDDQYAALNLAASTTALASLNIASGTAPTSPNNGDVWSDGTDIKVRLGGTTYTLLKA